MMDLHTFELVFPDGAHIRRTEWGRTRHDALKTIKSVYGELNRDFRLVEEIEKPKRKELARA